MPVSAVLKRSGRYSGLPTRCPTFSRPGTWRRASRPWSCGATLRPASATWICCNGGLIPNWSKDLKAERKPINARAETVAASPLFRPAFKARRALVPADVFYDWRTTGGPGSKQPYAFRQKDDQPIVFAGLWESWKAETEKIIRTFAIITTEANADMAPLHDRMPVILEPTDWPVWLGEEPGDQAVLLHPAPDGLLEMWPIGRAVNSPRNNGPELLEQVGL